VSFFHISNGLKSIGAFFVAKKQTEKVVDEETVEFNTMASYQRY
jgi:hypothetical protein